MNTPRGAASSCVAAASQTGIPCHRSNDWCGFDVEAVIKDKEGLWWCQHCHDRLLSGELKYCENHDICEMDATEQCENELNWCESCYEALSKDRRCSLEDFE